MKEEKATPELIVTKKVPNNEKYIAKPILKNLELQSVSSAKFYNESTKTN